MIDQRSLIYGISLIYIASHPNSVYTKLITTGVALRGKRSNLSLFFIIVALPATRTSYH